MSRFGRLAFPEAQAILQDGAVALLPVGATEAHGPHLPLDTDVRIAEATCERALPLLADRLCLEPVILPPVAYSVTEYAAPFAGTIGVPAEAAKAFLTAVLTSAAAQGFRAICLVNAHLEPAHRFVLRDAVGAAREGAPCPIVIADPCDRRWVPRLTEEFRSGKCHAGRYESSILLATDAPVNRASMRALEPVDIDLVGQMKDGKRDFRSMGAETAYFGWPAEASAREGHATLDQLADIVATVLCEVLSPLENV